MYETAVILNKMSSTGNLVWLNFCGWKDNDNKTGISSLGRDWTGGRSRRGSLSPKNI